MKMFLYNHPYHLVSNSPWPIMASLGFLITLMGSIEMFYFNLYVLMLLGSTMLLMSSIQWWRDVTR